MASVAAVLRLAGGGATVPFIARYRKEETGQLDEVAIRQVIDAQESWDEIVKRQTFIVAEIDSQGKLTPQLQAELVSTFDLARLEDLYLPFKQKRKTKATVAREAGLEPLASWLWDCGHGAITPAPGETPEARARAFCDADKGIADVAAALAGAGELLTERLAEDPTLRQTVRAAYFDKGHVRTRRADKAKPNSRFENYFAYQERVAELRKPLASHRYLAMRRGWVEEELMLSIGGALPPGDDAPVDGLLDHLSGVFEAAACSVPAFAGALLLRRAARMALRAYVVPAIENEVHKALREVADEAAIAVFADNVRKLLMAAPFGPKAVLGVDPGIRTGCKLAVIDGAGKYVGSGVLHLETIAGKANAAPVLADLVRKGGIAAVAVGNGTAGRETETFVREALRIAGQGDVPVVMVSEAGASVYSASDLAREEFPELDVTVRGAISIARRLQDPLAELVKIDPKSIGVGQYQHDVSPHALKKSLDAVIDSCVNQVGVNLNTASYHLLSHVSGIGPGLAKAIVERRARDGLFRSRTQLLEVPRFSKRVFEQAAGFLRIPEAAHPLDATGVHPERYAVLEKLAAQLGVGVVGLLGAGVKLVRSARELEAEVGAFTLADIIGELEKPGRDPRAGFIAFSFRQDIHTVADLQPGMVCPGIVTNVTNFGAFVDVGVHQDGLVHISQLADRFVKDPREVVSPGDRVTVRVLEVKREKNQIALTMKAERAAGVAAKAGEAPRSAPAGGGGDGGGPGKARFEKQPAGSGGGPRAGAGQAKPAAPAPFNNPFAALDKLRRR
ncbi:MAG TPA: Tex family protein [Polyangia bacterium]|nr:Tex family protein [Polyangia bacterium]